MRDYSSRPILPCVRHLWEFQAVLSGEIRPTGPGLPAGFLSDSLWLFAPETLHGWAGRALSEAEIAVFHFENLPYPADLYLKNRRFLRIDLSAEHRQLIRVFIDSAEHVFRRRDGLSGLQIQSIRDQLTLMICSDLSLSLRDDVTEDGEIRVARAESILRSEIDRAVNIEDIADRIGVSTAHLRRLFRTHRHCSPREARTRISLEQARSLAADTRLDILDIALSCGYSSHSSFTRAYAKYWNETPRDTRKSTGNHGGARNTDS